MLWRFQFGRPLLAIAAWLGVSVVFAAVQSATGLDTSKPLLFLLLANGVHFGLWGLTLPVLAAMVRRFPLQRGELVHHGFVLLPCCFIVAFTVSLAYVTVVYFTLISFVSFPLRAHVTTYAAVLRRGADLFLQMDLMFCVLLVSSLHAWRWWQAYRSEQLRNSELENRLANAHLNALRMQLHPHFLFNTLHSISALVTEDVETARRMIVALGDFLRLTLEDRAVQMRSLTDELEFMRLYVAIEKMRLGDRMRVEYDVGVETMDAMLPYLILQPLVENAIRHGVARIARPAGIWLRSERMNGELHLTLQNDGPRTARDFKPGLGITNTLERLRLHYGEDFHFQLANRPEGGCLASLTIPYRNTHEEQSTYVSDGHPDSPRSDC
jgi:two-component system, LytTR family, sensor kinase